MATKHIQGQKVTGKRFCFKWLGTENVHEKVLAAERRAQGSGQLQVHAPRQRKEKQTQAHTSSFFMRRLGLLTSAGKSAQIGFYVFFHLQVSELHIVLKGLRLLK